MNPLTYVIINLGIVAVLSFGGHQVNEGDLTQGQVIALVNYMSQILTELVKLANLVILLSKALASLSRVNAIFDLSPSITKEGSELSSADSLPKDIPAVSFENVGFAYAGSRKEALQGISFSVMPEKRSASSAVPDSGKTTLANLIPRF